MKKKINPSRALREMSAEVAADGRFGGAGVGSGVFTGCLPRGFWFDERDGTIANNQHHAPASASHRMRRTGLIHQQGPGCMFASVIDLRSAQNKDVFMAKVIMFLE